MLIEIERQILIEQIGDRASDQKGHAASATCLGDRRRLHIHESDFVYRKRVRVEQIQLEIRDETAKDPLDPMELGIRYAEFQAFCEYLMDPSSFGADDRGYSPYRFSSCEYR